MTPVKIAILGCGLVTEEYHLPAALASRQVELTALIDSSLDRGRRLARKYGCTCRVTDTLDDETIAEAEGVVVATPNHTHAPLARRILERGRPTLIEKPLAITYAEALELCDLAKRSGCFISVGFMTRHYPVVPLFKRLLSEGFLGRPERFCFEYGTKGGWAPASAYTLSHAESGGGVLTTNGTHFLDRMLYWFGEPTRFRYADDNHGGVEANCKVLLEFDGGLTGELFFSKTLALRNRFEMTTDRYTVQVPYSEVNALTVRRREAPDIEMSILGPERSRAGQAFRLQLEEFCRVIRAGGTPTVPGEVGALSVRLCEALYASREPLEEPWAWYAETGRA